jgi:AcrR family transcriptional regulator
MSSRMVAWQSMEPRSIQIELYSNEMRDVKSRSGSLRAERAAVTRDRIEAAARTMFARQGYAATTLREIAAEAGVAVQTVYAVYGTKANVLRALIRSVIDDPGADAAYGDAMRATSVDAALTACARSIRLRWENGHDVVRIHAEAASAEPALRRESAAGLAARRSGITALAGHLVNMEPSLGSVAVVTAVLDALTQPVGYVTLVVDHGWSADAYETWLADLLSFAVRQVARPELAHQGRPPRPTDESDLRPSSQERALEQEDHR